MKIMFLFNEKIGCALLKPLKPKTSWEKLLEQEK